MKTKIVALAGSLALSLLTTVVLADVANKPDDWGATEPTLGQIKKRSDCGGTAFFKNEFPSLTNGSLGGVTSVPFTIDGESVLMTVSWTPNNSFGFSIEGGLAYKVGVTVDTNNFIYDYSGEPVSSDGKLNSYLNNIAGDDVNHLDLCLTLDKDSPVVMIESPSSGDKFSGTIPVLATVTDNVKVDSSSVKASIDGTTIEADCQLQNGLYSCSLDAASLGSGSYTVTVSANDTSGNTGTGSVVNVILDNSGPTVTFDSPIGLEPVPVWGTVSVIAMVSDTSGLNSDSVTAIVYQNDVVKETLAIDPSNPPASGKYTWLWQTLPLAGGVYRIQVSATDTLGNVGGGSVTVDVLKQLTDCFGLLDEEDFPEGGAVDPYANGCKPTPLVNVQAAPYTTVCNPEFAPDPSNIPAFCYLSGELLLPDETKYAGAADKYIGCDACALNYCGDLGIPDPRMYCDGTFDAQNRNCDGEWKPKVPLQPLFVKDVAQGNPDLVLGQYIYGNKGCFAAAQHTRGGASIVDLYPVWPVDIVGTDPNEATGAVFVKTDSLGGVIPDGLGAQCNAGLLSAEAGYQPIGKTDSVDRLADGTPAVTLAGTQHCRNPARKVTRDNGYDVASVIETDGSDDLLTFKYARAEAQFDGLFAALDCARPTLLTGKFSDVTSPVNQAKAQFDNGTTPALERALEDLIAAEVAIREETTWQMTPQNCAGDALARVYNLSWRISQLLDAQTP